MLRFLLLSLFLLTTIFVKAQEDYKQYMDLSYEEIDSLVNISYEENAYEKAVDLLLASRTKALKEFGKQDSIYATYTADLSRSYKTLGQYNKALPLILEAKEILHKIFGNEHPSFTDALNTLAVLYIDMGRDNEALPICLQLRDIDKKKLGEEHPDYSATLTNLAIVYSNLGNNDKALSLLLQSKAILEKQMGEDAFELANTLSSIAVIYYEMGDYDKAVPLLVHVKNIYEKVFGAEHPTFAQSLINLASIYRLTGNHHEAISLFIEAKDIYEKVLGKEHPILATISNNLASLYEGKKNYEKALLLYMNAKQIYGKALGEEHPTFATVLNNLAHTYEQMDDNERALPLYMQAKDIYKNTLGSQHPRFAGILNNIAGLYWSMKDYDKSWRNVKKAMHISCNCDLVPRFDANWRDSLKEVSYPSSEHIKRMLHALTYAFMLCEDDPSITNVLEKQQFITELATILLTRTRNQLSEEKDKLRILAQSNEWLANSLSVLSLEEHQSKAFQLADENKSVLLLQAVKSEEFYRLGELPDSLVLQDKKLLKERSSLQAKLYEKRPEEEKKELRSELIQVNQDIDAFVKMIQEKYPKYHKLKYAQVDAKVEEIQALLDEETALIEYVISDSIVHIFRVDKDEVTWHQEAMLDSILKLKVEKLHHSLSDYKQLVKQKEENFKNYTELAHWFYQKLLAPVVKEGGDIENLIIVSDGELGHLPFESFLVEAADGKNFKDLHYLLKDYNISYNYSATLWKENKEAKKRKNNGQMLAMAANYSEKLDSNLVRSRLPTARWMREALSPLPAAREEVEALAEQFKGFFGIDSLATERIIREKAADYAIIHLAMHGLLDEDRPMLSSLALTEDGDSLYDNFWQAHEISKMELNADLVVLSACETGYGRFETGNGIASLARAFMYAGVPSLVVSLWQVNDQSTSIIMQNFYKHLASGMSKSAALRQAKLDYIETVKSPIAAHPAFWSPFILIGDESPVKLQRKGAGAWIWWGIGASALLLAGLGFGLARRKKAE